MAVFSVSATDASKNEGNSGGNAFTFTVTRTGDAAMTATVDYTISGSGSDAAGSGDFTSGFPSGTLAFAPNETSKIITVQVAGDTDVEPDEGFVVTLSNASGDTLGSTTALGIILNDDTALPVLTIAATDAHKAEGTGSTTPFTFTVTRSGNTNASASVDYTVTGTGANPADAADFGGTMPSGTVSFGVGESSKTVTLNVAGDGTVEPDETFAVTLSNPVGMSIGSGTATGTIQNDDSAGGAITGTSGPDYLSGGASADVLYGLDGNDTLDGGGGNNTLYGGAGNDMLFGNARGADLMSGGAGNDTLIAGDLAYGVDSLYGGDGNDRFTFAQANASPVGGGAMHQVYDFQHGVDKIRLVGFGGGFTPAIMAGTGYTEMYGSVPTITYNPGVNDVSVFLHLGSEQYLAMRIQGVTTVDPSDFEFAEPGGTVWVTADGMQHEGQSGTTPFTFTVTRAGDTSTSATVSYTVTGVGANPADATDFGGAMPSGTVSFAIGESRKTITVNVAADTTVEPDEAFVVSLHGAVGTNLVQPDAGYGTATALGTIVDDDAPGAISGFHVTGTTHDDFLTGSPGDDVIHGLAGRDNLSGLAGNDTLYGGDGADRLRGGPGADLLDGGTGNDVGPGN
ncbi:Calx-beta domain-containing protein, partial [Azospirillum sp.]|uniref:Calx-beta domain-containing protein n=1 Tax=Azospirillum sp. TaxID=34012 RepID=UPI002D66AE8A